MNPRFKYLVQLFRKLPGVGPRQAARFVLALLDRTDQELQEMGSAIASLRTTIRFCSQCFNISENHLCAVCANHQRDTSKILIVEKVTDLDSVEKTGLYHGLYHVLGGALNPVDGITPERLRIRELAQRTKALVAQHESIELIVATNPTVHGETTALYLQDIFKNEKGIAITCLARGLASGSHLEYADEITLKHALEERR
jgi:recombination protein RecR